MNESEVKNTIVECFDRFDKNHDGVLDLTDVIELVKYGQGRTNKNYDPNP